MTKHKEERFRAVVKWKKLRPYYPDTYVEIRTALLDPTHNLHDYYQEDRANVGEVFTTTFDKGGSGYTTLNGAKAGYRENTKGHPFCSIYGDGQPSIEILSVTYERAEPVWVWKEV